jgi:hypothetical protein
MKGLPSAAFLRVGTPAGTPAELQEARRRSGRLGGRPGKPTSDNGREAALERLMPKALRVLEEKLEANDQDSWRAAIKLIEYGRGRSAEQVEVHSETPVESLSLDQLRALRNSPRFAVLVVAGALVVAAGAASAKPPPGPQPGPGIEPVDPVPATLCAQLPHPTVACSAVAVICPSSPKEQFACRTGPSAGPVDASMRTLELQLPRRYPKLVLACQAVTGVDVVCRVVSRTITRVAGVRVVVLRLPDRTGVIRIACATTKSRFACAVGK